jgi:hypothetical protein
VDQWLANGNNSDNINNNIKTKALVLGHDCIVGVARDTDTDTDTDSGSDSSSSSP